MKRIIRKIVALVGRINVAPDLEPRLVDAEWRAYDIGEKRRGRVRMFGGGVKIGNEISGTIEVRS